MAINDKDPSVGGDDQEGLTDRIARQLLLHQRLVSSAVLIAVGILILVLFLLRDNIREIGQLGYIGVFLVSLLGSAAIVVPLPGLLAVFAAGAVWDPLIVGIAAGVGMTLGESTGWALGYAGQGFLEKHSRLRFLEGWMKKAGGPIIFGGALIPNPVFDMIGFIAGSQRYPLHLFLLWAFPGKTLRAVAIAYAGRYGMEGVLRLFGG